VSARPPQAQREQFTHFHRIGTRWMDNDMYGHVNNVVYYSYFDTAVNAYLIKTGALSTDAGDGAIGLVVETGCNYFAPLSFPDELDVGLRVAHLGRSSVRYELAIFAADSAKAVAQGHFVHVYVDRRNRRPVAELPKTLVVALTKLTQ
jgi:acyl-CoA thioester hydrolase